MTNSNENFQKIELRDNLFHYFFMKDDDGDANSIFVLIDQGRKKALILDTAFKNCAEKVKDDLSLQGIEPEIVVLSHYHPDHAGGTPVFSNCQLYASEFFQDNYENSQRWRPDLSFIRPSFVLKDGNSLDFGSFNLKFIHAPGHSKCMLLTLINDDVLHIGDLLMFTGEGSLSLPYISMGGSFKEYIESLKRIKTIDFNTLAVAHGYTISEKEKVNENIDDYIYYLTRVLNSEGNLPLIDCLKKDISDYARTEHHDNNLMFLMF